MSERIRALAGTALAGVLAAAYALHLLLAPAAGTASAPLVAAAILLCGELVSGNLGARRGPDPPPGSAQRRRAHLLRLTAVTLAGVVVGYVVLAVASVKVGPGIALTVLGALAAVLALWLTALAARRS